MTDSAGKPAVDGTMVWLGLDVKPEGIPYAIKAVDQWVTWRAEPKPDGSGMSKVPYQITGAKASSTNPATWTEYAMALAAYQEDGLPAFSGIGFAAQTANGLVLLDFDHVRNALTGVIDEGVLNAISYLGTYAELSPSGTGVRVIGQGTLEHAISGKMLQGWSTGRYVTITGHHVDGTPADILPIDPARLAQVCAHFAPEAQAKPGNASSGPMIDQAQVLEIRQALGFIDPDESYDVWVRCGMALAATGAPNAFGLWNEWSIQGGKYNAREMRAKWASFRGDKIQLASLFKLAQDRGWVNPASREALAFEKPTTAPRQAYQESAEDMAFPGHLLREAPGMLGKILSWGLASAHKPLPQITLQAAFAIASAAASRRYRTNLNNWPSLWFLNLEVTASGKEHPESLIESVLDLAGLGNLVAGAGYTSPGAIFSTLMDKPAHVAIIDEFGKLMQSTQANGNQHKADAITLLMQAFSSCHRVLRPPAYSAMTFSRDQREAMAQRKICNPGVVIYASTTPSTFYSAMNRQWIEDGFIGRFIVCHSTVGRQVSRVSAVPAAPPQDIIEWAAEVGCRPSSPALAVRSSGIDSASDFPPEPIGMVFSQEAIRLFDGMESDIHARMSAAERWGVEALFGRTREKAMRMAMLVCLAEGAQNRIISGSQAQYASDYVLAMDAAMVESAKSHVSDSDFARIKHACLERLRRAGAKGLTPRELEKKLAAFDALKPREQQDILAALHNSGLAEIQTSAGPSGRGRKRVAWVAVQEDEDA